MNLNGLIVEGIAGTGKSTFLYELQKSEHWQNKPFISSVILSEHHTLRVLEQKHLKDERTKEDSISLLDSHVSRLEQLKNNLTQTDWLERDRVAQKIPFVFERFHLTHVYHYDDLGWGDVASIDSRLNKLSARLALFTIDEADIKERIIEDYKKAGWQDYLQTLGSSETEIIDHFVTKQNQILDLSKESSIPLRVFNTSKLRGKDLTRAVIEFSLFY